MVFLPSLFYNKTNWFSVILCIYQLRAKITLLDFISLKNLFLFLLLFLPLFLLRLLLLFLLYVSLLVF